MFLFNSLLHALLEQVVCLEAEDGEDDHAGVEGGEGVGDGDSVGVKHTVLVNGVVAAEADDGAEGEGEREEDLKKLRVLRRF